MLKAKLPTIAIVDQILVVKEGVAENGGAGGIAGQMVGQTQADRLLNGAAPGVGGEGVAGALPEFRRRD